MTQFDWTHPSTLPGTYMYLHNKHCAFTKKKIFESSTDKSFTRDEDRGVARIVQTNFHGRRGWKTGNIGTVPLATVKGELSLT